ncbi:MAG: pilus assembly protein [Anaerolineales bacterium]|nr:pilus assembly protein [Anaerolineales bacterium]
MKGRPCKNLRSRPGQAVVELAVVLPILLILFIGIINLGILINSQVILTQAAWEGARAGATVDPMEGSGDGAIVGAIRASASGLSNPNAVTIDVTPPIDERDRGIGLTVKLHYPLRLSLPIPLDVSLSAEATSRIEYTRAP